MKNLLLLAGDGIGVELTAQVERVLARLAELGLRLEVSRADIGGAAIDKCGDPFPSQTRMAVSNADAVLLGAVGGPAWDHLATSQRPESALLALRATMKVFANLRPLILNPGLLHQSPLKNHLLEGLDIMIVRELIGGIYFGEPRGEDTRDGQRCAYNTMIYNEAEVERVARVAFSIASERNQRLTSVDKANVLEVSRFWREVVNRCAEDYPQVQVNHMYVDNAAMQLVLNPQQFDVVLTSNLFGDILSDLGAAVVGSIGLLPSASLSQDGPGLFEPVHGSAPDLVGSGKANPLASLYSLALLLRHCHFSLELADRLERAIKQALAQGLRTADIHSADTELVSTTQMVDAVCAQL